jgi:hypothetical protein
MERPAAADQEVGQWMSDKPDTEAMMASGDPEKSGQALGILKRFLGEMKEWHKDRPWRDTAGEWLQILSG